MQAKTQKAHSNNNKKKQIALVLQRGCAMVPVQSYLSVVSASLDFTINRFFMKLFSTSNIEIVKSCQEFFGFELPSTLLSKRIAKFESVYYNP